MRARTKITRILYMVFICVWSAILSINVNQHERRISNNSGRLDVIEWRDGSLDSTRILVDQEGKIQYWPFGMEEATGWTNEDVIGKSIEFLIPPEFREVHWKKYQEAMSLPTKEKTSIVHCSLLNKGGKEVDASIRVRIRTSVKGEKWSIVDFDLTPRVAMIR